MARVHPRAGTGTGKGSTPGAGSTAAPGSTTAPVGTVGTSSTAGSGSTAAPVSTAATGTTTGPGSTAAPGSTTGTGSAADSGSTSGIDMYGFAAGGAIQDEDSQTLGRDLGAMAAVHGHWLRIDINWAVIQAAGPSSYNWAPFDRVVAGAQAHGLEVLGVILYTPPWARPAGTEATYGPDPGEYAAFAQTAVRHFSAQGVHAYEIWNEPNTPNFWKPKPNPAAYTTLLKAAYLAIKAVDAQATVVTGGTAPAPSDGTSFLPVDFLRGIYANGGKGFFDAVGHHPYCAPAMPGEAQSWSAWYQMYGTSPSLRSTMIDNGDEAKKIWATEFGAPTGGPRGSYVSEAEQAQMLTKAYVLFKSYSWAGPLMWYAHRDQGTATTTRENFYGLQRNDFSLKPAFDAYRAVASP